MNDRKAGLACLAVVAVAAGCARVPLPAPISASGCVVPSGVFRAGIGRVDITPPPGIGLAGYGPEGRVAAGHRSRLYARALVLEDRTGERLALLVADLPLVSAILQRGTAARLRPSDCLGADRLLLAATHTHAGPGNYMMASLINSGGSSTRGYDPAIVEFMVERLGEAVRRAVDDLSPAVAAWGETHVWGLTRNRNLAAYLRNHPQASLPSPPRARPGRVLEPVHEAVDPAMTMLRVDRVVGPSTEPLSAFTIFAMHQTGNPSANDLYDGDIFALAERGLERHIDDRNGRPDPTGPPRAVALFAVGSAGDVSPDWPRPRTCPLPRPKEIRRPTGPRAPDPPTVWDIGSPEELAYCVAEARAYVAHAGAELSGRAVALFDSLGGSLRDDYTLGRAFETTQLRDTGAPELCDPPRAGTSTIGGVADGYTRYHEWSFLGLAPTGFEEGERARRDPKGCHGPKRPTGGALQALLVGRTGLPHFAQLMIARIGPRLIGAVPWEVTTTAGVRIRATIADSAGSLAATLDDPLLVTLSNGYLQYLTTPEEYAAQGYEGGSNVYGPRTAEFVASRLGRLARGLAAGVPVVDVTPEEAEPGALADIYPRPDPMRPPDRRVGPVAQAGDTLVVRWDDAFPGDLVPADGPMLSVESGPRVGPRFVTWDDDPGLEVRALRRSGSTEYTWEAKWTGCVPGTEYRFVVRSRPWRGSTLPQAVGDWFRCS
ncbi:MAG: neutral/alkaline non-lysosomal ceramidase N-terminal domain-containing protein [Gemmatimonadetes bacterium]|nr:neutral/alkaline non-lysosomal ceramidase N-terminal domain-containing protein [Gemmatimonadota bacterium]